MRKEIIANQNITIDLSLAYNQDLMRPSNDKLVLK